MAAVARRALEEGGEDRGASEDQFVGGRGPGHDPVLLVQRRHVFPAPGVDEIGVDGDQPAASPFDLQRVLLVHRFVPRRDNTIMQGRTYDTNA
jgi:hypothetical protein